MLRDLSADRAPDDFGGKLRDARERRGVSLREIANATKISIGALEALERNDISKLPGGIFSRAFVRSYAAQVGLDPEHTIQEFIAAFPHDSVTVGHASSDSGEDDDAAESRRRMVGTLARLIAVSLPIAALILYLTIAGRRPATVVDLPAVAAAPPVSSPLAGATDKSAIPDAGRSSASENSPSATTGRGAAPLSGADAVTPPAPAQPPPAQPPPPVVPSDGFSVGLSVRTPCVVSATVDGKKAIDQVLRGGDTRTIDVQREIVLTVGDASAIVMTLNGAEARPLGKPGEVVTTRLTLANFKDYVR